jgi:Ca2+-binding EF-hand superfamily protein
VLAHVEGKAATLGDAEVLEALRRAFRTPMEAFRAFDKNLDGTIDRAEFEIGLASVSAPRVPCAGLVARLFSQVDVDELGFITMGRMCDLLGVY